MGGGEFVDEAREQADADRTKALWRASILSLNSLSSLSLSTFSGFARPRLTGHPRPRLLDCARAGRSSVKNGYEVYGSWDKKAFPGAMREEFRGTASPWLIVLQYFTIHIFHSCPSTMLNHAKSDNIEHQRIQADDMSRPSQEGPRCCGSARWAGRSSVKNGYEVYGSWDKKAFPGAMREEFRGTASPWLIVLQYFTIHIFHSFPSTMLNHAKSDNIEHQRIQADDMSRPSQEGPRCCGSARWASAHRRCSLPIAQAD